MATGEKDCGDTGETSRRAHGADQQQLLSSNPVNYRHGDQCEKQIGSANRHGLKIARNFAETRVPENIVQIVKNCIDARKLVEHSDAYRQENGKCIFSSKQLLSGLLMLDADGGNDVLQIVFVIFISGHLQHGSSFVHSPFLRQPTRASRNGEQHNKKQRRGKRRDAQLPTPFRSSQVSQSNQVI